MVVEDERVSTAELPERRQRHVVEPGPAMHEQQRGAVSDHLDEHGNVTDLHRRHVEPPHL